MRGRCRLDGFVAMSVGAVEWPDGRFVPPDLRGDVGDLVGF